MAAGPSGAAPRPPPWLSRRALPIIALPSGTRLFRIHRLGHGAVFFSPPLDPATGERQPPTYRFDSASGAFGVLYAAEQFEGAFVETILRNPQLTFVSQNYVTLRGMMELACSRDLRLVDMHGRGLSRIGTTNAVSTGPLCALLGLVGFPLFPSGQARRNSLRVPAQPSADLLRHLRAGRSFLHSGPSGPLRGHVAGNPRNTASLQQDHDQALTQWYGLPRQSFVRPLLLGAATT